MLISNKLNAAVNSQIGSEFGASLQYVQIASYFESEDLLHLGKLFFAQSDEERMHAMKFVKYILDAGGAVEIPEISKGRHQFKSAEDAVEAALHWELEVTKQINGLMDIAVGEKDYIAQEFLNWFVTEQLEEVSKMRTILSVVKRSKDNLLLAETYIMDALPGQESGQQV